MGGCFSETARRHHPIGGDSITPTGGDDPSGDDALWGRIEMRRVGHSGFIQGQVSGSRIAASGFRWKRRGSTTRHRRNTGRLQSWEAQDEDGKTKAIKDKK